MRCTSKASLRPGGKLAASLLASARASPNLRSSLAVTIPKYSKVLPSKTYIYPGEVQNCECIGQPIDSCEPLPGSTSVWVTSLDVIEWVSPRPLGSTGLSFTCLKTRVITHPPRSDESFGSSHWRPWKQGLTSTMKSKVVSRNLPEVKPANLGPRTRRVRH